ncbi:MAG: hypothetical protein ACK4F8_14015 [Aquabacterium sp.]
MTATEVQQKDNLAILSGNWLDGTLHPYKLTLSTIQMLDASKL